VAVGVRAILGRRFPCFGSLLRVMATIAMDGSSRRPNMVVPYAARRMVVILGTPSARHITQLEAPMTSRQFVAVAVRLFAIWLALASIRSVLTIFVLNGKFSAAAYIAYAIAYAVFAAFLWHFPMKIAERILSSAQNDSPLTVTPLGLIHAAIVAAGLVLLTESVPSLLNTLAVSIAIPLQDADQTTLAFFVVRLAAPIAQIIMSLIMIFRAPTLASRITTADR
jgi:hypothetical protein